jgi:hypothetical protein
MVKTKSRVRGLRGGAFGLWEEGCIIISSNRCQETKKGSKVSIYRKIVKLVQGFNTRIRKFQ